MIPVTIIIAVKQEHLNLSQSLPPLKKYFSDILIVDSNSADGTEKFATHQFTWNGQYPKKRQWILDNIPTKYDWVFMIDADEIITDNFIRELQKCDLSADGYFVSSRMVWNGRRLRFGKRNNKLCLFKKSKFMFPTINDLDIDGMGEIEGHYQPVAINNETVTIGQIKAPITHHDHKGDWNARHDKYIQWEVSMNNRKSWPQDPVPWREFIKSTLRTSYARPVLIFTYTYIFKLAFLDGTAGLNYAFKRAQYTWRIVRATRSTND